ncbi:HAD family phosphatase [Candidatus Kaiserbacteria bacterium]|nr:HAD family phosphatase [Candidatus Kaiserbacteria bacterium]MCB9812000.1 HAD family phosphatase [Candidatus Nomurabacteria bacterium]
MSKQVAFFDIDGTVFRSSLLIELVEQLIKDGVFAPEVRDEYATEFAAWRDREGSYEEYIGAVVRAYMRHIKGVFYGDLADIGRQVVARQSKHVYRYTRDLIKELKEQDYYVVAISQSPKTILDEFCKQYGFDKVYGRIYETGPQDLFTGAVADEHLISNKANIVSRVVEREQVSLTGSVGVGDTEGDISLLDSVERPICFNPNKKLYEHAKHVGWEVVVERKDMIYTL